MILATEHQNNLPLVIKFNYNIFIKKTDCHLAICFFYTFTSMENQTQIFGIRAVIEAANAGETIDKAFLQKGLKGELFNELKSLLKSIF
ncbi:hypothetical protein CJ739_498 [Mariniflexile rhizosphaerae]|nr:hypothetical protein CJ739_498 [Mariniflexile sp. TRM1-10]